MPTKKVIIIIGIVAMMVLFVFFASQTDYGVRFWHELKIKTGLQDRSKIDYLDSSDLDGDKVKEPVKPELETKAVPTNESGVEIPQEVHIYTGRVIARSETGFIMETSALENYLETGQQIEVRVDEKTIMTKIIVTVPTNSQPEVKMLPITLADIAAGETVTVTSSQNINGVTSFRAETVRVVK